MSGNDVVVQTIEVIAPIEMINILEAGPQGPKGPPGDSRITVSETPPTSPLVGDIWIDVSIS